MPSASTQVAAPDNSRKPAELFSSPGRKNLVLSLALVLLTVVVYLPVRNNAFINFDDNHYITENPHVKAGLSWDTVNWAFTTYDAANWHPLTWLSHALDCELFGLNPAGHHFVNLLLHGFNAILLFLILQSLTGFTWRSLMVSALFAVHPLNVESVAWAAERKTILSTLLFLLAIWAYGRYVRRPGTGRYLEVAGFFALALMSKPQVITLPFVLLLLDYWPLGRTRFASAAAPPSFNVVQQTSFKWLLLEKLPLLGFSAASAFITLQAQRSGHAVRTVVEYSLGSRIETAIVSYAVYVRDAFFPRHLAPIYPHAYGLLATWQVVLAAAILIGLSALAVINRKRAAYLLFGWLWFLGTLVPMIGLIQVGEQARADRYMYISLIGILVACVWGVAELFDRYDVSTAVRAPACAAIVTVLSIATFQQTGHWRDSETLWNYTMSVTNRNFMAEDNLAQELAHQGRTKEALVHFHNILGLHDWQPSELIAFGMYEQRQGYAADAILQYQHALSHTSDSETRSVELSNIGSAYLDLKKLEHARQSFDQALELNGKNVPALIGAGIVAQKTGNLDLAIRDFTKAVSLKPTDLGYALLGRAFEQSGRTADANAAYAQAQTLSPDMNQTRSAIDHLLSQ
ncbi:MAG TPA: tetratricopeptide repeat protein [Terriglobales bacterium]|nr:tetratricopeptide repeat protein [Terriglobales bacterium]